MKGGLPRRDTPRVVVSQRREARRCCTSDWISAASGSIGGLLMRAAVMSRSGRCRLIGTGWQGSLGGWAMRRGWPGSGRRPGARFVHDQLELAGWDVRIADAVKARGIAPLACKTDRIDCWVLAELARLDLIPEIWLPDPRVRAEREQARFRLYLVRRRSGLKNRIPPILFQHGVPNAYSDLFAASGRRMLEQLRRPEPWVSTVAASLALIDRLDQDITACERELRALTPEHPYLRLLMTCPGIGELLAYTIAAEIGDISRFASPRK